MPQPKMKNNSPDNFQTDPEALDCLVPYLKKTWNIWEPACGKEKLVNSLDSRGFNVVGTDILWGSDFLKGDSYNKAFIDAIHCIITNPPFSLKEEFLARCYQLKKPFALLMPITTFDSVERRTLFQQHGVQIIFPQRRINFETPNHAKNVKAGKRTNSWFYTAWFTWGLDLPAQLNFSDPKSLGI